MPHSIEISVSNPAELRSLREHLRRIPDVTTVQASGTSGPTEQGAWDTLQVLGASSGVLAVAIKTLPEFIRSRRSDVTVTVKSRGRSVTVTATNIKDALAVVEASRDDA
ncbi:hypothetical protein ABZ769_15540 [Streptomyces olivoreticuli]